MNEVPAELRAFHATNAALLPAPRARKSLYTTEAIKSRSGLPWLPVRIEVPHEDMLAEARALKRAFVAHRSDHDQSRGWRSICIHGLSSAHTASFQAYGYTDERDVPYDWTDICKFATRTHAFFRDTFGYRSYRRVRFMLLEPGGYVMPHVDFPDDRLVALNIALNNPEGCDFVMEGEGTVMPPRTASCGRSSASASPRTG